eukprot:m.143848 g.143848  ORF g.143848 m.143848 type:complete len:892 (+) comp10055_c4_seq2:415-3090(+)
MAPLSAVHEKIEAAVSASGAPLPEILTVESAAAAAAAADAADVAAPTMTVQRLLAPLVPSGQVAVKCSHFQCNEVLVAAGDLAAHAASHAPSRLADDAIDPAVAAAHWQLLVAVFGGVDAALRALEERPTLTADLRSTNNFFPLEVAPGAAGELALHLRLEEPASTDIQAAIESHGCGAALSGTWHEMLLAQLGAGLRGAHAAEGKPGDGRPMSLPRKNCLELLCNTTSARVAQMEAALAAIDRLVTLSKRLDETALNAVEVHPRLSAASKRLHQTYADATIKNPGEAKFFGHIAAVARNSYLCTALAEPLGEFGQRASKLGKQSNGNLKAQLLEMVRSMQELGDELDSLVAELQDAYLAKFVATSSESTPLPSVRDTSAILKDCKKHSEAMAARFKAFGDTAIAPILRDVKQMQHQALNARLWNALPSATALLVEGAVYSALADTVASDRQRCIDERVSELKILADASANELLAELGAEDAKKNKKKKKSKAERAVSKLELGDQDPQGPVQEPEAAVSPRVQEPVTPVHDQASTTAASASAAMAPAAPAASATELELAADDDGEWITPAMRRPQQQQRLPARGGRSSARGRTAHTSDDAQPAAAKPKGATAEAKSKPDGKPKARREKPSRNNKEPLEKTGKGSSSNNDNEPLAQLKQSVAPPAVVASVPDPPSVPSFAMVAAAAGMTDTNTAPNMAESAPDIDPAPAIEAAVNSSHDSDSVEELCDVDDASLATPAAASAPAAAPTAPNDSTEEFRSPSPASTRSAPTAVASAAPAATKYEFNFKARSFVPHAPQQTLPPTQQLPTVQEPIEDEAAATVAAAAAYQQHVYPQVAAGYGYLPGYYYQQPGMYMQPMYMPATAASPYGGGGVVDMQQMYPGGMPLYPPHSYQ